VENPEPNSKSVARNSKQDKNVQIWGFVLKHLTALRPRHLLQKAQEVHGVQRRHLGELKRAQTPQDLAFRAAEEIELHGEGAGPCGAAAGPANPCSPFSMP